MYWLCLFPTDIITQEINRAARSYFRKSGISSVYALPPLVPVAQLQHPVSKEAVEKALPEHFETVSFAHAELGRALIYFPLLPETLISNLRSACNKTLPILAPENSDQLLSSAPGIFFCALKAPQASSPQTSVNSLDPADTYLPHKLGVQNSPAQYGNVRFSIGVIKITTLSHNVSWITCCRWSIEWKIPFNKLPFQTGKS